MKGTEILVDYEYDNPLFTIDQRLVKSIESKIDALTSQTGIHMPFASILSHFKKSVPEIILQHKSFNEDEEFSDDFLDDEVLQSESDSDSVSRKRKIGEI